jgi:hypothetical protein
MRQADLRLDLLDLHRHRRRRQVQVGRGARHAALLRNLRENPQLPERDVHWSGKAYRLANKI